jgi:predicted methyltransferase
MVPAMRNARVIPLCLLALATAAAAERKADPLWVIVNAPDRTDDDKKEDASRKPLDVLRFSGVKPGMHVADIGAGGGYTTELLARAVGPKGVVYAQNTKTIIEKFVGPAWEKRLASPADKNVKGVVREFDEPLPPDAKDLDLVVIAFIYHDTVWLGTDRAKMNKQIFDSLKKGGVYLILDHAGRDGTGTTETKTLHRIEKKAVIDDVTKAGFKLEAEGDFLRNPDDPKTAGVFTDIRGKTDRFALKFVKP